MSAVIPDTPRQIFRKLADIERAIGELREGYVSDYEAGYGKKGRSVQAFDPDFRPTSEHSDPTGNAVADLEHVRRSVARIANRVGEAHAALDEASAALVKPVRVRKCVECGRPIQRPFGRRSRKCEPCDRRARRAS